LLSFFSDASGLEFGALEVDDEEDMGVTGCHGRSYEKVQ
jgi:hypothetical protein